MYKSTWQILLIVMSHTQKILTFANFINVLIDFNIDKLHEKPMSALGYLHKPIICCHLAIKSLVLFPNLLIQKCQHVNPPHFHILKNFHLFVSKIPISFVNSKWHFQELKKYPYSNWRSSNLETIVWKTCFALQCSLYAPCNGSQSVC